MFAETRRAYFERIASNMVERVLKFIENEHLAVPPEIICLLGAILLSLCKIIPFQGFFKNLLLQKMQPAMIGPHQTLIMPHLQALLFILRCDGSFQTCRIQKMNIEVEIMNPVTKKFEKKVCLSTQLLLIENKLIY